MSLLLPFRALRPAPHAAARVASVPYDVVNADEARALAAGEPLSFLRVTRAEIDLPPETSPYDPRVYARAARNFADLGRAAPMIRDEEPSLYVYRLRMGRHEQTGVAGCSRWTSTNAASSRSTRRRARTRKTIARGTCVELARADGRRVPDLSRVGAAVDAVVGGSRARRRRRSTLSRRRTASATPCGASAAPTRTRSCAAFARAARALHRRRPPSRRERRTRARQEPPARRAIDDGRGPLHCRRLPRHRRCRSWPTTGS